MLDIVAHSFGLLGMITIGFALVVIGRLSARLGSVTHARPYFVGNYIAAGLIWLSVAFRFYFITRGQSNLDAADAKLVYTILSDGLPALGLTVGLLVTWYYWSWLLAERD